MRVTSRIFLAFYLQERGKTKCTALKKRITLQQKWKS
uniref:Uncharacterized protein n=1 Tax=Rhizophora mucronata TaxID=61149 RepID=A0A2P2NK93_RHIMU